MSNPERKPGALRPRDVMRRFDRASASFSEADFVHRHAAAGLLDRMSPMRVDVKRILDVGAATGSGSRELARQFRGSRVLSVDWSGPMLARAKKSRSRFARISEIRADAMQLPLRGGVVDLVFANMLLPWIGDLPGFFAEAGRVLRKDGLFMFSTLGPDSLGELRQAWAAVDEEAHVNAFLDMHDVGDTLLKAGLREPVLDVDYLTVRWRSPKALFDDLTRSGARNSLEGRRKSLTGKGRFGVMQQSLPAPDPDSNTGPGEALTLRLEMVYGHAWGGGPPPVPGEARIGLKDIGRRLRNGS